MNNAVTRPLKVFLCHASGDKPPVREFYKRLLLEGVDAWLDQEKLLPGQDWRVEIPQAVQEADVVIVFLSNKSVSKEGYVQKEIKFALDIAEEKPEGTIFLIPARLEDCLVPERLSRWQWVDLYDENGFLKLLRSLKLRANKVGAVIEPTFYADTDKEFERKLDQLYTEGLAAFWVEDWDKACQRFRAILSEYPGHANATQKLGEAERQRNLAKLYVQSTEACQAEDWSTAIKSLDELLQKSADYRDAVQLLKNAKKQKRLKDLYFEAKTLYGAQKWQAVLKVFEQISAIEPAYPDPENLLASAQTELAESERLAELNSLYSQAVHDMDNGQWVDARKRLEQVHKSQIGFLETERLLRKVEDEIAKVEELNQRNIQVNTLYEQAHGLIRSKSWRMTLDKIEEIQKLDDRFIDEDGISEIARAELEREEEVIQQQNELAAMYAEAVRLLKEEKYQEALDRWQEVKALDPKYPDRHWVQRTAKNKLAETAKPIQIKPRVAITKSHWIGIVAFIVVAVVIMRVILSGKGSQNVMPTSISAPISPTVVPIPTTSGYTDPTMYDDFDKSAYNGSYNNSLWNISVEAAKYAISQEDGKLSITVSDKGLAGLNMNYPRISKLTFFEAREFLDPATTDNGGHLFIVIDNTHGHSNCGVFGDPDNKQSIKCWSEYYGKHVEPNIGLDGITPGWHVFRFELEPESMIITYIVDGRRVGSYDPKESIPDHFLEFKQSTFNFVIALNNYGPSRAPVGYVDHVRMGAIADDSTVYDSFDRSTYNGAYDQSKWKICASDPGSKVVQENGVLSMTHAGTTSGLRSTNLCAQEYQGINVSEPTYFEASLMFPDKQIGLVSISVGTSNDAGTGCFHHYFFENNVYQTPLHCNYVSQQVNWVSKVKDVVPGTWHTVRIEVQPAHGDFIYYLDGQQYDSYHPGSDFRQIKFWFLLSVTAESPKDVIGFIDNVRIGRIGS